MYKYTSRKKTLVLSELNETCTIKLQYDTHDEGQFAYKMLFYNNSHT